MLNLTIQKHGTTWKKTRPKNARNVGNSSIRRPGARENVRDAGNAG